MPVRGANPLNEKFPAIYILASARNGTLYIGVTSDLYDRVSTHKVSGFDGFTKKYGVTNLVWYEHHHSMNDAIKREKQLKEWKRAWKLRLIESMNPRWDDLHESIDSEGTLFSEERRYPHFNKN
jgi:putative endonuclease